MNYEENHRDRTVGGNLRIHHRCEYRVVAQTLMPAAHELSGREASLAQAGAEGASRNSSRRLSRRGSLRVLGDESGSRKAGTSR
jgi:hypothetical protein